MVDGTLELDWWQGADGYWYPPYSTGQDVVGARAPKVTGRRVWAALIDLVPLGVLFTGLATRFG